MNITKPIKFKEANRNLLKSENIDKDCKNLWVYSNDKECISCWKTSLWNRIKFLFHGKIWLSVLSGETQPPVWILCDRTPFIKE